MPPARAATRRRMPPVIGKLRMNDAIAVLANIDEPRVRAFRAQAKRAQPATAFGKLFSWSDTADDTPAYRHTEHQFGYFAPVGDNPPATYDIVDAAAIPKDANLKNQPLRITLDRLRVFDYPGEGEHIVLVDFAARHVTSSASDELRFSQKYRATEGTGAGVRGYPVFVGIRAGEEGIALQCYTVNVENSDDKKILGFLDAPVFKRGLELLNTVNPVVPIVTGFVTGITEIFAKRHNNVPVQDFFVGLDFSDVQTRARLREGTYVCVQAPEASWDWSLWQWNRTRAVIETKTSPRKPIPYNYVVLGVSKMTGADRPGT